MQEGIIGHVHIADNFGYYDEHLTPGEGNVPVEEFMKEVVKAGLKDKMVIEPGAQGEGESIYGSMFGAWAKVANSQSTGLETLTAHGQTCRAAILAQLILQDT